jgi:RimJ/RimL family protein N-acetyltransferase
MRLVSVYERPDRAQLLYNLLEERAPEVNISHKAMPSWDEHVQFVESKPYQAWYFIEDGPTVGACYLSKQDEIGVFIFKEHQGKNYATWAIETLMMGHGKRRYLANISPQNGTSMKLFRNLGFRHVQNTYEREAR